MALTSVQRRVMQALEEGATIDEVIEQGLCSAKSISRWDISALRGEYRRTIAPPPPPPPPVSVELPRPQPEALVALAECISGSGKQTQFIAARFVLEHGLSAEAGADTSGQEASADLAELERVLRLVK